MIISIKCPKKCLYLQENKMIPRYELINYQDKLYYVYRRIPEKPEVGDILSELKEYWMCDLILKNKKDDNNMLIFLREIPDADII